MAKSKKYYILIVFISLVLLISCEDLILGPDPENTPTNNFDILWKEFDRYYPSFVFRNIHWDSLYSIYRSRISTTTTETDLWDIVTSMLYQLNDLHVTLHNKDGTEHFSSYHSYYNNADVFSLDLVKNKYLQNTFNTTGEGNFTYGKFPGDSLGYVYISTFYSNKNWVKDIDLVISNLSDVKSLIIDIRENPGGLVPNLEYIASTFITVPVTFRQEISRNGPNHNNFTPAFYHTIYPRLLSPQFTKEIVILTNRNTSSTAEIFALFFKQLIYSIQIGDSTAGGLGPIRGFQLPNGWLYQMPVAISLTLEGQSLEGIGVQPDIFVRNTEEEILHDFDHELETAIQYLLNKKK